jgi:hypothetical protein
MQMENQDHFEEQKLELDLESHQEARLGADQQEDRELFAL